jgi:two-component system sensor histidine kinase MprB
LSITVSVLNGSLFVSDDGPGIAVGERDRIFDRFYRSDRDRSAPGSGLGLAIVAKAAAEHAGSVWVREAEGGGAEVGFTVPELKA